MGHHAQTSSFSSLLLSLCIRYGTAEAKSQAKKELILAHISTFPAAASITLVPVYDILEKVQYH
jgi:hypothetical protein